MEKYAAIKTIKTFETEPDVPRSSEGDFARLPDGSILFAYSRFSGDSSLDDRPSDIYGCLSADGGNSFSAPVPLQRAADFGVTNAMSVTLRPMADGGIGLFFGIKFPAPVFGSEYFLSRSADGRHFDKPTHCLPAVGREGYYVVNNCRVERLSCGRLLMPAANHKFENGVFNERAVACFYASDDDGASWFELPQRLSLKSRVSRTGLQEPGVIELPDGQLEAYFRTDLGCQYMSFSSDCGESWSEPEPSPMTSPASPMKIARDPFTGYYVAIYNPIPVFNGRQTGSASWGRTPLAFAISRDGLRYGAPLILEDEEGRGYCYPSVFFTGAGEALLSYCSGGIAEGACLARTTVARLSIDYEKIIGQNA